MQRWACGVSYVGTDYHGWQKQPGLAATVEQVIMRALQQVADAPIQLQCAGRTDRGVHALGQVIHFDSAKQRSADNWVQGANQYLPASIKLQWARPVSEDFHARYSAISRCYHYVIYNHSVAHPLLHDRVWWVRKDIRAQQAAMQAAANHWLGEQDFSSFRDADCQAAHPVRSLHRCEVQVQGRYCVVTLEANAFLHHMVRNMMGVLIEIGLGKRSPDWALAVLRAKNRTEAGMTVPASGLYLSDVGYPAPWDCQFPSHDGLMMAIQTA